MGKTTLEMATELRQALKKDIVRFSYFKKDGSLREAVGTRNLNKAEEKIGCAIPAPKTDQVNENAYFDLDKKAWRSFIPENVVSID